TNRLRERRLALLEEHWMQIAALRCVNRLCRVEPSYCAEFASFGIQVSESFNMNPITTSNPAANSFGSFGAGQQPQNLYSTGRGGGLQGANSQAPAATVLYAEVLFLLATLISRAPYATTIRVMQRLNAHANQWFNFGYLFELLPQHFEHYVHMKARNPDLTSEES
ncbi:unnamed protein product, partial [Amoebophrya sp. A120]